MNISKQRNSMLRSLLQTEQIENKEPMRSSGISFCNVSRFEPNIEGRDLLFRVLSEEKWKTRDWVLELYGESKEEENIKHLSDYYGISDKVFFIESDKILRESWKVNNILFMPAMAKGTPVILIKTTYCGNSAAVNGKEFIIEPVNGTDFSNGMEKAWAKVNGFSYPEKNTQPLESIIKKVEKG